MKATAKICAWFRAAIISTSILFAQSNAAIDLTVSANTVIKEVTRTGSGSLYGITEVIPADLERWVKPLKPYMFTNPGLSGVGHQHNNRAAAVPVAERLWDSVPGAVMSITLPDMWPGWPYNYGGWEKWEQMIRQVASAKLASRAKNFYGYVIWNEPLHTWGTGGISGWNDSRRNSYHELWRDTYRLLRQVDPQEKIIGPCFSWYNEGEIERFLNYTKTTSTVPDIMCWHPLGAVSNVTTDVGNYRKLETRLGISPPLPITFNEYGEGQQDGAYEGCPGRSAAFIAKLERLNIHSANISWWHTCCAGRLGSLMASNTEPGAGWYFYKWYGDMSGNMISVTPPSTNSKRVDGFANIDSDKKFISLLFGGENDTDGTVNVTFNNLPSWLGNAAIVKIEAIDWVSKDTRSNGPRTISETERQITNNSIAVSVTGCNNTSGYRIYITPANATPSITATCNLNNLESSYTSGSLVPRPNVICSDGSAAGAASFTSNGNAIDGWEQPGGTHALYVTGTRNVTMSSVVCGGSAVTLSPAASCGSFEIIENPSSIAKMSLFNSNSPYPVVIYNIKGNKIASSNVSGMEQIVNLPLPSGIYIAKLPGMQSFKFVVK